MLGTIACEQMGEIGQPTVRGCFVIGHPFDMVEGIIGRVEETRPNTEVVAIDEADHVCPLHENIARMAGQSR